MTVVSHLTQSVLALLRPAAWLSDKRRTEIRDETVDALDPQAELTDLTGRHVALRPKFRGGKRGQHRQLGPESADSTPGPHRIQS
jgi:hypothetical protein